MKLPASHGRPKHQGGFGGFGQAMLERMGWSKGQGLGKAKDGMAEALDVKKKEDTLGVGATASGWKWDWKYWEDAYNTGLASVGNLGQRSTTRSSSDAPASGDSSSGASSSSSSGSDSASADSSDSSDEDEEHAARLAAAVNHDGTSASASAAELAIARALAKQPSRVVAGRFGGREGKMARIRAQEEAEAAAMRAKLGLEPLPAQQPGAVAKRPRGSSASEEDASADTGEGKLSRKARRKQARAAGAAGSNDSPALASDEQQQQQQQQQPAAKKPRLVVVVNLPGADRTEAFAAFKPTPPAGWWGCRYFRSAGLLEGLEQEAPRGRQAFDEGKQEAVYMAAHGAQRQGKRGIGKAAIKIAGGNWAGQKVTFDEAGEAGTPPGEAGVQQPAADEPQQQQQQQQAGKQKKRKRKEGQQAEQQHQPQLPQPPPQQKQKQDERQQASEPQQRAGEPAARGRKVKWVALAVAQLAEAGGGPLRFRRELWPRLQAAAAAASLPLGEGCREACLARLRASSRLQVAGKKARVSLAAA